MGRPGKTNQRVGKIPPLAALGAALWLAACAGGAGAGMERAGGSGSAEGFGPWTRQGRVCVLESEEAPVRRIINRVDPELCGRKVKQRSPFMVRMIPQG